MAKLPSFENLGQSPVPRPEMGVVSVRNAGQEMDADGRALTQTGNVLQSISNELWQFKEKTDTTRVEDAWNQYKTKVLDYTHGEGGLLKTEGANAVSGDLLGKSTMLLADARTKIADSLTDDQKRRFFERADVTDLDTKRQVLTHLAQQQTSYAKTVFQGSEAAAKAQIAADPKDPGVFAGARDTLLAQADAYLKQNGVDDKGAGDALKAKLTDSLWVSRINALLYAQPALADAMFRANQDQIKDPDLRLLMQNKVREVSLGVTAGNEAERIMTETRNILDKRDREQARLIEVSRRQEPLPPGVPESDRDAYLAVEAARKRGQSLTLPADYKADGNLRQVSQTDGVLAPNTSGLPTSRDIAAQLPVMMGQVERRADDLYGPDKNNPDRAAFVKRLSAELQSRVSSEVQQLNAIQRQSQGMLIDAVAGLSSPGNGGLMTVANGGQAPAPITSFAQIMANPQLARAWQTLDPQAKLGLERLMEHNLRANDKGDERLYRSLFNRIHLDPADPNKIDFYAQIIDPQVADRLSMQQINALRLELDRNETPGGRSVNQMRKAADANVAAFFKTHIMFTAQPDRQIAATMRWNEDAGRRIDELVKAGKTHDVRRLFMLDTPESIISPKYLQTYVDGTQAQGLATGAAGVRAGDPAISQAPPATQPANIATREQLDAWFASLPPNVDRFVGTDGKVRMVPPRQAAPSAPQPAAAVPAAPAQPVAAPAYGPRVDGTQKGNGFLGPLRTTTGETATEISIGVNIDGKETQIPSLVPTLTPGEVTALLAGEKPSPAIVEKAVAHAKQRMAEGKSPFADGPETTKPVTMDQTGKIVTSAPAGPVTVDAFEVVEKPDTVAGNIAAIRTARARAMEIRKGGAQGPQYELTGPLVSIIRGIKEGLLDRPAQLGRALQALIPTELEAVYAGFDALKQSRKISRADEDVLTQVIRYGLLTPDDEKLARGLLERLGKKK